MRISSDFCLNVNEDRISNFELTSNLQLFLSNNFQLFSWNQNDRTVNEGGACVYIFLEQYGFGPFSHGEIFFTPYRTQGCRSWGGVRGRGGTPSQFFAVNPISSMRGNYAHHINAFRIFRSSYGSASCFRSKFFLPSCPRLGDIEKDKYT